MSSVYNDLFLLGENDFPLECLEGKALKNLRSARQPSIAQCSLDIFPATELYYVKTEKIPHSLTCTEFVVMGVGRWGSVRGRLTVMSAELLNRVFLKYFKIMVFFFFLTASVFIVLIFILAVCCLSVI